MIGRTLVLLGMSVAGPLAAQERALRPAPSPLYAFAPAADSVRIHPTYWKEGALAVGIPLGLVGALAFHSLCTHDDSAGPHHCTGAAIGGAVLGAVLGGTVGALIGGQFPKHDRDAPAWTRTRN